jgi:hypothetical protein
MRATSAAVLERQNWAYSTYCVLLSSDPACLDVGGVVYVGIAIKRSRFREAMESY